MEPAVKEIVQKAHSDNAEQRRSRRLEAQSSRRNMSREDFNLEISDKEAKTLSNLCKSGKLTVSQFRDLSRALSSKPEFSKSFLASDGCLHGLVGQLTGSDPAKQLLALQCLVNLAAQGNKSPLVAKSAGAYLITLIAGQSESFFECYKYFDSGTNKTLAEHSCLVISNLCLADSLAVPILLNLDAIQNLLGLAETSTEASVTEAALQALYQLVRGEAVTGDTGRLLVTSAIKMMNSRSSRDLPPIHLLWLLYILSSSHQSLHDFLANQTFLHQCVDIVTYEIFQKCDSRPLVKLLTLTFG